MIVRPVSKYIPRIKLNTFLHNAVIIDKNVTGLTGNGQQAADPSIVWDPVNKRWLIYFFAYTDGNDIYVAESRDLLSMNFIGKVVSRGPSGSWESLAVEKPSVIYYNGKYYMFYIGWDSSLNCRIGLATSNDGINFTKYANNPILEDPEGTGRINAPSVIRWKDGNFYMWAYNRNGYNIVFRTTPNDFPLGWQPVGKLDSRFFGIYSVEALYDEEIDKIILLANIFYPKPQGDYEPVKTGYLAIYVGDEPLKLTYYGVLLPTLPKDTWAYPLRYCNGNVFAPGIAKVGLGKYVILLDCTEDGTASTERIFRLDLGVDTEQTLRIKNTYRTSTSGETINVLRILPGMKVILKHAIVYAYAGTPSELYLSEGNVSVGRDSVITWTNTNKLEFTGNVTINDEYLMVIIKGTPPIEVAYDIEVVVKPAIDEI